MGKDLTGLYCVLFWLAIVLLIGWLSGGKGGKCG